MQSPQKLDLTMPIFQLLEDRPPNVNASVYLHVKTWKRKDWVSKTIILKYNNDTNENEYMCALLTSDDDDNAYILNTYEVVHITENGTIWTPKL